MPHPLTCDLALKLHLPTMGEDALSERNANVLQRNPGASVSAPVYHMQSTFPTREMEGDRRVMTRGTQIGMGVSCVTDWRRNRAGEVLAQVWQLWSPRYQKEGKTYLKRGGATKKRKTQSGPSGLGQTGMISFKVDQPGVRQAIANTRPMNKKLMARGKKHSDKTKGSGGCPQTATGSQ